MGFFGPFHVNISGDHSMTQQDRTWQIPVASPFLYILTSDSHTEIQHLKKNSNILAVVLGGIVIWLFPSVLNRIYLLQPSNKVGLLWLLAQGLD